MKYLRQAAICLMGISLSACAEFPDLHPYILDVPNSMCGAYKEVSKKPIRFEFDKWYPLTHCHGYFALPPEDIAAARAWYDANYPGEPKP